MYLKNTFILFSLVYPLVVLSGIVMFAVVRVLVSLLGSEVFVKDTREGNRKYFCCLDAEASCQHGDVLFTCPVRAKRRFISLISFTQLFLMMP